MKKSLLLLSAFVVGSNLVSALKTENPNFIQAPTSAKEINTVSISKSPQKEEDNSFIDFSYASDVANAYALNNISSGFVYLAFQMPVEDQQPYIGCDITALTIVGGTSNADKNMVTAINAFVTDDLSEAPAETSIGKLSDEAYGENVVTLKTPFHITGEKPIYIGYRFRYTNGAFYLVVDEITTPSSQRTCLVGKANTTKSAPTYANYSDQIGSLCIGARIEGDNLPKNQIKITGASMPQWFAVGKDLKYNVEFKNVGSNAIDNVTFTATTQDGEKYGSYYKLNTPLACGEKTEVTIGAIPNKLEGLLNLTVGADKVNLIEGGVTGNATVTYSVFDGGYKRKVVIEEATGNWCGYCPRGIAMMEYFGEAYPDWIRIAVHGGSSAEPMLVPGYNDFINTYVEGFPYAIANRNFVVPVYGPITGFYRPIDNYYASFPAYANVDLTMNVDKEESKVYIDSESKFALNTDKKHKLTFVIVEDNVGPYKQVNNYYGSGEDLWGWENIPSNSETLYRDVARAIDSYDDVFPENIEKDQTYSYSLSMPLSYTTYGLTPAGKRGTVINPDSFRVVALITDAETGEIVNAAQCAVGNSGVNNAITENANVKVFVNGSDIVVEGTDNFSVYTLDGKTVSPKGVASGIYVVKAADKTFKVMVK